MDNTIYTIDMVCDEQICQQAKVNQKRKKSVWNGFRQLVGTIGENALEVLRTNNDPEPVFSNGGARVIIRPDRIDLV
jgi:hypothetical protein